MVTADFLAQMKQYQRVNHFPGMYNLSRKSNLCRNLNRIRRKFPKSYNFYPQTWLLPSEGADFSKQFLVRIFP